MSKPFVPSRLYIKRINDLWYFGKSSKNDLDSYPGSGKIWRDKMKKYGKDAIVTEWVSDWYYDEAEIREVALAFSIENDIIASPKWANLKLENGVDGGPFLHTTESRKKISQSGLGQKRSALTRQKIAAGKLGKNHPKFKGYYITPWGKFESVNLAVLANTSDTEFQLSNTGIYKWCKVKNEEVLSKNGMIPQKFWGKTPRELGFWFEPA